MNKANSIFKVILSVVIGIVISCIIILFYNFLFKEKYTLDKAINYYNTHNFKEAYHIFHYLAEKKHNPIAYCFLGKMYLLGEGVKKNIQEAKRYFIKACKTGIPEAYYNLGEIYFWGLGNSEIDYKKAFLYYQKSAFLGLNEGKIALSTFYFTGIVVAKDYKKGYRLLCNAAKNGNKIALARLGEIYKTGKWGLPQNITKAFKFIHAAASKGYNKAQYVLGRMYLAGEGTKKDKKKGLQWILLSAKNGCVEAEIFIGILCYFSSKKKLAAYWLKKGITNKNLKQLKILYKNKTLFSTKTPNWKKVKNILYKFLSDSQYKENYKLFEIKIDSD